jgi:hypothetical protein
MIYSNLATACRAEYDSYSPPIRPLVDAFVAFSNRFAALGFFLEQLSVFKTSAENQGSQKKSTSVRKKQTN